MTRKDYVLLAVALAATRPAKSEHMQDVQWEKDVRGIAVALKRDNSAFDLARFCTACGGN